MAKARPDVAGVASSTTARLPVTRHSRRRFNPNPTPGGVRQRCYAATTLRRSDLLLAFLAAPSAGYEADQIRIMKELFLLSREGPGELDNLYFSGL